MRAWKPGKGKVDMQVQVLTTKALKGMKASETQCTVSIGDNKQTIEVAYKPMPKGGARRLFVCPNCGGYSFKLLNFGQEWQCRKCCDVNLYRGIQNTTKGGADEIAYRMAKFAEKKDISDFELPFDYMKYCNDDRSIQQNEEFRKNLKIMQALENMRFQAGLFGTRYSAKLLKKVITGMHPLLYQTTLYDLRQSCYDWKKNTVLTEQPAFATYKPKKG